MAKRKPDLVRRQQALEKTVRKYRGQPFEWGKSDCVTMARSHLVKMGHRGLPKLPKYRDAIEAKRALKKTGHGTLEALLDSLLPRIAPAMMLPGDLGLMGDEDGGRDALVISVGHKVMGWHQDADRLVNIVPARIDAAWRA